MRRPKSLPVRRVIVSRQWRRSFTVRAAIKVHSVNQNEVDLRLRMGRGMSQHHLHDAPTVDDLASPYISN